jgi:hypothetical protein
MTRNDKEPVRIIKPGKEEAQEAQEGKIAQSRCLRYNLRWKLLSAQNNQAGFRWNSAIVAYLHLRPQL